MTDETEFAPELDYAFLANWAGIQADGTMTAVGMSFLRAFQAEALALAVAGRIRFHDSIPEGQLGLRLDLPGGQALEFNNTMTAGEESAYGDGHRQVLFVLNTQVPVRELGQYKVTISIDDQPARYLFFEVMPPPGQ